MALEESDGYMASVLERRPTLAPQVDELKHEHAELARIMDGVHRLAKAMLKGHETIKAVRFAEMPPPDMAVPIKKDDPK